MENKKVAFYTMTSKGLFVLRRFVEKFGSHSISYIIGARDKSIQYDAFDDMQMLAKKHGIRFYERTHFDIGIEQAFNGLKFAIGWRWIIHSSRNLVVFHDSLLPRYRGFAPLVNSLINKEKWGGVTALLASDRYDCGDILGQKSVAFNYPLKIWDAIQLVEPLYFELVDEIYSLTLADQPLTRVIQNDQESSYSLWLDDHDYYVDWTWPAGKIARFVDAVGFPYSGAMSRLGKDEVILKQCKVMSDVSVENRTRHLGKVIFFEENMPVVVCAEGLLAIKEMTTPTGESLAINFRSRFA
jgi:methionyl-tRNA formyltransferase